MNSRPLQRDLSKGRKPGNRDIRFLSKKGSQRGPGGGSPKREVRGCLLSQNCLAIASGLLSIQIARVCALMQGLRNQVSWGQPPPQSGIAAGTVVLCQSCHQRWPLPQSENASVSSRIPPGTIIFRWRSPQDCRGSPAQALAEFFTRLASRAVLVLR